MTAPELASMLKSAASGPPVIAYVIVSPSGSVAITVVTAVEFSKMDGLASEVKLGGLLTVLLVTGWLENETASLLASS